MAVLTERYESERYRALVAAVRDGNHVRQTALLEEGVAQTSGGEKAFWLLLRAGRRLRLMLPVLEPSWIDLESALALAPDDPVIQRNALTLATALSFFTEDLTRVRPIARQLKAHWRRLCREYSIQTNISWLQFKRGRWNDALRALNRAIAGMGRLSEAECSAMSGALVGLHAKRVIAAIACGHMAEAVESMAEVNRLEARSTPEKRDSVPVSLARAELAYVERRFQDARTALQTAFAHEATGRYGKAWPESHAEMNLMAARIARAEGKREAFQYFIARALQITNQHHLALTEVRIRAVMDGAER